MSNTQDSEQVEAEIDRDEWRAELSEKFRFYIMNPPHSKGVEYSMWVVDGDYEYPIMSSNTGGFVTFNSRHDTVGDHLKPTDEFLDLVGMAFTKQCRLCLRFTSRTGSSTTLPKACTTERPGNTSCEIMSETEVNSNDDRIKAKVNDSVVEADWKTMERLAKDILSEADNHKTDLQKAEEISGAHIRVSCDCCDWEAEFEYAREVRERRATPEEHVDHPDFDCTLDDVSVEAFCPRHGTIPMSYDECDGCAETRAVMNR